MRLGLLRERLARASRLVGLFILGAKLRARAARCGDDTACLIHTVMTTSFVGRNVRPIQRTDELRDFLAIVRDLRPGRLLEIGSATGGTLFLLCRVASPDALILSLDLPNGPFGGYGEHRENLIRSFAVRTQTMVLIRGDSHDVAAHTAALNALASNELDLLLIDGDRSYEGVKADYFDYAPLVRRGGLIAIHDICPGHPILGDQVARFWEEVAKDQRTTTIITRGPQPGFGFGIIFKGSGMATVEAPGKSHRAR